MRVIGLTGGIACGKSNVSDTLRTLGAFIIDGDAIARQLTLPGGMALAALREAFGDGVFAADGSLNRRALGARVFADSQARATLDGIMQPMIRQEIQRLMAQARTLGAAVCVLDMPLLDTRRGKDLVGTFLSDVVLQVLSFVAESERSNIRQRQAEGIAAAKARGVRFGRPETPYPDNFREIPQDWRNKKITLRQAADACKMPVGTFYGKARRLENFT